MYTYRRCEARDYAAIASIRNLVTLEQVSGEALRKSDEQTSATRIVAASMTGAIVGYALVAHFAGMVAGRWWIHVTVHPDRQRTGIGRQLYRAAEELAMAQGATEIESVCGEEESEKNYAFALAHGFISDRKRFELMLDLPDWDSTCIGLPSHPVELLSDAPSDQRLRSLYDLVITTETDVPSFAEIQPSFSDWSAEFQRTKQAVAVALDGEQVLAASFIQLPDEKSEGCYIPYSGVLREYRGRGLARAVKLAAITVAQERGYPFVWTHNDADNPAILKLNLSLGFRTLPGLYRLKKSL